MKNSTWLVFVALAFGAGCSSMSEKPSAPVATTAPTKPIVAPVAGTQLDPDVVQAWIRMTETRPC